MTSLVPLTLWIAGAGAAAGALNAIVSDNAFVWPSVVTVTRRRRIVRPGLILNMVSGAAASVGGFVASTRAGCIPPALGTSDAFGLIVGAIATGALAARWLTNEADKRLLRAAVAKACSAPAAHPDTAHAVEFAAPFAVYVTAEGLIPQPRAFR